MKKLIASVTLLSALLPAMTYARNEIYGGLGAGADLSQPKRDVDFIATTPPNYFLHNRDATWGALGRGFLGFKYTGGQYGLGLELGGQFSSARTEAKTENFANIAGLTAMARVQQKSAFDLSLLPSVCLNQNSDAFLRLGYRKSRITAESGANTGGDLLATGSDTKWLSGYLVGFGVETTIIQSLSARFEYTYSQYDQIKATSTLPPAQGGNNDTVRSTVTPQDHEITISLVFHDLFGQL